MIQHYTEALNCFVDLSTKDASAVIAKDRALLGLCFLLEAYEQHGIDKSGIKLLALPDFTFTRNLNRWNSGFSYGYILFLGNQTTPLLPLGFRPNCCGVLLIKIPEWHGDSELVCKRLIEIIQSSDQVSNNDLRKRNHFICILRDEERNEHYALLHGSFSQIKKDHDGTPGLYIERSKYWQDKVRTFNDHNLTFPYLVGEDAELYFNQYLQQEEFSLRLRREIFKDLFPGSQVVFHRVHEGFFDRKTILLGAYMDNTPFDCPIMLSPDADMHIVSNSNPISKLTDCRIRADSYCSPHGGGYQLTSVESGECSNLGIGKYRLKFSTNNSTMLVHQVFDLPFGYRKNVAEMWCNQYEAAEMKQNLTPLLFFKV